MILAEMYSVHIYNKNRYDCELPYQRPDLIEVMEIEIDLTISTNVHGGHHIIGLCLGVILCILGSLLKGKVQNGGYFRGLIKFQIFCGCLKFLIIFWGEW